MWGSQALATSEMSDNTYSLWAWTSTDMLFRWTLLMNLVNMTPFRCNVCLDVLYVHHLMYCVSILTFVNWHETQSSAEAEGSLISFIKSQGSAKRWKTSWLWCRNVWDILLKLINANLMVALKKSRYELSHYVGRMNVCTLCCHNPVSRCWNISQTTVSETFDLLVVLKGRKTKIIRIGFIVL